MNLDINALEAATDALRPQAEWVGEPGFCRAVAEKVIRTYLASLSGGTPGKEGTDDRLYDDNVPMADGEIKMTAAEDVLAWLLIEKIGVPDDRNYTPKEAQDTIARTIDSLRKYEDAALATPPAEAAPVVQQPRSDLFAAVAPTTMHPCEKHPDRYCNCDGFYPACREARKS